MAARPACMSDPVHDLQTIPEPLAESLSRLGYSSYMLSGLYHTHVSERDGGDASLIAKIRKRVKIFFSRLHNRMSGRRSRDTQKS
ncbi:hypothetical protein B0H13DRAFT_2327099 [Mycena leptocephala]|nr:hypothetical protein B0H13DRAFT_2327099 [Mycena leptocephala]